MYQTMSILLGKTCLKLTWLGCYLLKLEIGQIYYALGLVLKKVFKVYLKEIKPL